MMNELGGKGDFLFLKKIQIYSEKKEWQRNATQKKWAKKGSCGLRVHLGGGRELQGIYNKEKTKKAISRKCNFKGDKMKGRKSKMNNQNIESRRGKKM